jgi:hypothetical protein
MKSLLVAALLLAPIPAVAQGAAVPTRVFASPADLQALIVKARGEKHTEGIGSVYPISVVGPYQMQLEYRTGPTRPALHHQDVGWAYVVQGTCTLVTQGSLRDSKPAAPGSTTDVGTAIDNGVSQKLAKGDFIMIPPNMPHQFLDIHGEFIIVSMHLPMPAQK